MSWLLGAIMGGATAYILGQLGVDIIGQMAGAFLAGVLAGYITS